MARKRRGRPISGWLILDKEAGQTSAQAVAAVRRITGAAKAGHGGTLDPLATGVLPIALGEATKAMSFTLERGKSYRFAVRWGEERDTDDAEGQVVATAPARPQASAIEAALALFRGAIEQRPPSFSAIKVEGQRAYKLAREGEALVLAARAVTIHRFALIAHPDADTAHFEVDCGKGTYVRALARDLGRHLGCLGHVISLRRTRVGGFDESQAISLAKLGDLWHGPAPFEHLLPIETALDDIPALALTGPQADRLRSGQTVRVLDADDGIVCAMNAGKPVALAEAAGGDVRPVRVFNL